MTIIGTFRFRLLFSVMIIVFVVDTAPSMGRPACGISGISRLDVAKMLVEDFIRQWRKMRSEHNRLLGRISTEKQRCVLNLGQYTTTTDQFFLLSTAQQNLDAASASAVRFTENQQQLNDVQGQLQQQRIENFQKELKGLHVMKNSPMVSNSEEINYATGLNAALSAGLQLLSRYRLHNAETENFGMGRLPNCAVQSPSGGTATAALQSACLILVTDGACLRLPPNQGGGSLKLQFGSQPLRDLYREPFRWDQRIYVKAVGGKEGVTSSQYLHPQLRALCEVTGGSHWMVKGSSNLSSATEMLLKSISPPMPREFPLPEPLFLKIPNAGSGPTVNLDFAFINGGPICCFQSYEVDDNGRPSKVLRAMLLYSSSTTTLTPQLDSSSGPVNSAIVLSSPVWCIPETFFPNSSLLTLPPRPAQPLLMFSKHPLNLGLKSFDPVQLIKMLYRLDQLTFANRKLSGHPTKCLHRDVYVCEWINPEGGKPIEIALGSVRSEYFPVFVQGAGRSSLSEESEALLNIGILHIPASSASLSSNAGVTRLSTLTILPPEPHILLPLLVRAAEAESKTLKRAEASNQQLPASGSSTAGLIQKRTILNPVVPIDEHWRSEFRAYLFRLPPYYQNLVKRCLRPVLPSSVHMLLQNDDTEPLALQCFSKTCQIKIKNGEQIARDNAERYERHEHDLGIRSQSLDLRDDRLGVLKYGQYDPRSSIESYLAALRNMPPPWKILSMQRQTRQDDDDAMNRTSRSKRDALDVIGDIPAECLMAYYESRRRWIFGGPGLSTRGLHVDGVRNDGGNSQHCGGNNVGEEECILSLAGVGVSTLNRTSTSKMGEYKERLLFLRSPVVGYGSNDSVGVAATTAIDGSPKWSCDNDVLPISFFDPKTGEFADSVQARVKSKLQVNFGNPYKEKRADSLIPEKYLSQAPPRKGRAGGYVITSLGASPESVHGDSFESVEEGEAMFVRKSPSRALPKTGEPETPPPPPKRPRSKSEDSSTYESISKKGSAEGGVNSLTSTDLSSSNVKISTPETSGTQSKPRKAPLPPKRPPPPKPSTIAPSSKSATPPAPTPPAPTPHAPTPPTPTPPASTPPAPTPPAPTTQNVSKSQTNPTELKPPPPPNQSSDGSPECATESTKTISAHDHVASNPSIVKQCPDEASKKSEVSVISLEQDLENPDVKPMVDLAAGWISVWSKSKRRWYFFDKKTNKSVWNWPP